MTEKEWTDLMEATIYFAHQFYPMSLLHADKSPLEAKDTSITQHENNVVSVVIVPMVVEFLKRIG